MADTETKQRFIVLRAKGTSYEKIANELAVSKQSLINWSKEFELDISNLKAVEMDSLYEQYYVSKQKRVEVLGKNLELLKTELDKRDFSDIPTDKLLDSVLKYATFLKGEFAGTVFKERLTGMQPWDMSTIDNWNG